MEIARQLRIKSKLKKDKGGAKGVGSQFPTWSSAVPITAQVFKSTAKGSAVPWGPVIPMNPAFADEDAFLLGRIDFFRGFKSIRFAESASNSTFVLEY